MSSYAWLPRPVHRWLREGHGKVRNLRSYRALRRSPRLAVRYFLFDREIDNFTYNISNKDELATFLASALNRDQKGVRGYIDELDSDRELRADIEAALVGRRDRNRTMPYGRRLGWYAIVRATKPRVVVETGVHDGLGSAILLRALERNAAEGAEGALLAFDIRADVGWLIPARLRTRYELHIENAITGIRPALAGRSIDFFIHDSDHRYEHETSEFETVSALASPGAVLISDNAHAGNAFRDFCDRQGLAFRFFHEAPANHFYPGAGIGLSVMPAGTGGGPTSPEAGSGDSGSGAAPA